MLNVGFLGLGVMGEPMAGHMLRSLGSLTIWNRTPAKTRGLEELGASIASSIQELASRCDAVFLCVNRTEDVWECLNAMSGAAKPGTIFVDHSTISPNAAREMQAALREAGLRFVDAPITGGSMGAQKGQLTIFCGGEEADVAEVKPLLDAYARRAERVGGPGAGQMMKMVNQIAVGGSLLALCEALSFAKRAGLDIAQTRELVGSGAAGSWAFENYGPKILAEDWSPGFTVVNQRKDFGYVLEAASDIGAAVPGTMLVDRLLAILEKEGHGDWTTAALYETLLKMDNQP